jgi:WD40 repeat protein
MALAPDNATVCTASADETIRFWKVFNGSSPYGESSEMLDCSLNSKFNSLR